MFTSYSKDEFNAGKTDTPHVVSTPENEIPDKYDLEKCIDWIEKNEYKRTCLQFPMHLLNDGTSIVMYLQSRLKTAVYLLADTSYGSCCVDEVSAQHVDADSVIHFGHACLSPVTKLPVMYVFEKEKLNLKKLQESLDSFNEELVIFYDDVYHYLHKEIISLFSTKPNITVSVLAFDDQEGICGRSYKTTSSENIIGVYLGKESITLQNLVLSLPDYQWYQYLNEELKEYNFNRNKFLMQRSHLVDKVRSAKVLGILFGTVGIKNYLDAGKRVKMLSKRKGKKCYTLVVGKPNVAKLANFPEIDVFVCIACRENSLLKDFKDYYKPIVSLLEVEMALGDRPYDVSYTSDFRELLPGGKFYREIQPEASASSDETSQELLEKEPGTVVEFRGADFLTSRSWRGLELSQEELKVSKAVKGRSGIPQAYENELETINDS